MNNSRRDGQSRGQRSQYNDHDDRTVRFDGPQRGRGGFKSRPPKRGGGFYTKRNNDNRFRGRLDDDDVSMAGENSSRDNRQFTNYGGKRGISKRRGFNKGGIMPRYKEQIVNQLESSMRELEKSEWYKVTLLQGKKTEKMVLLKSIAEQLKNVPFIPINFTIEGLNAVFYIDNQETAKQLLMLTKKITVANGFKLIIIVRASQPPVYPPQFTKELKEKLKVVMSSRYDPSTKMLDLSAFHDDTSFRQEGLYLALQKYSVLKEVMEIIETNIPELESLNLSSNGIYTLDALMKLHQKTPSLSKLSLANNELKHIKDLDPILKLPLLEVVLDGNRLCDTFRDEATYISALRQKFPKLLMLDGQALPEPIKIELEKGRIPPTLPSNFGNDTVKPLICRFCQEYFTLYDTDNRSPLAAAYHEDAVLSLSVAHNNLIDKQPHFGEYMEYSRNLLKVNLARTQERLLTGRSAIIALLTKLPQTQHDPNSFVVDVSLFMPTLLTFTVSGLFKEDKNPRAPVRHFTRTFITAPQGEGIVVLNDSYQITNALSSQYRDAFKTTLAAAAIPDLAPAVVGSPPAVVPGGATVPAPLVVPVAAATVVAPSPELKLQMVQQFSQQSGMNQQWSTICLEETGWNYEKAAVAFTEAQSSGKIPAEAFVK